MEDALKVIVIDSDSHYRMAVRQQLNAIGEAVLVGEAENVSAGLALLRKTQADVVILDVPKKAAQSLSFVEKWRSEFPGLLIYGSSTSKSPEMILGAMRAGITEYLSKPMEVDEFEQAIKKAERLLRAGGQRAGRSSTVIGVFSKKGGLGVTTIAVNLAVALGSSEEARTLLVDLGFDFGDAASLLDLAPEFTIADLLDSGGNVEPDKLQSCLSRHPSGIFYFGERETTEEADPISPEQIRQILDYLRESFRHVVLDLPHTFDSFSYEAFEMADTILLVATADLSTIRATRYALKVFRSLGYDDHKIKVVLNRSSKRDGISRAQFEETVEHAVDCEIPNNYRRVIESINVGEPFVVAAQKSDVAKSMAVLANRLRISDNGSGPNRPAQLSSIRRTFGRK